MRLERLAITAALAFVASACGPSIQVSSDWDPAVDFAQYQTFAVLDEASGGSHIDQFTDQRIKAAIASTLTAKGMRQIDDRESADVAVGWQLTTEQRSSYQTVNTGWGSYGYRWGGWYGGGVGMSTSRTTETRYEVGTLVVALFDEETDSMIFTATGSKRLSTADLTPQEAQARINEAVEIILRDFPPAG